MAKKSTTTSQLYIKHSGSDLPPQVMGQLIEVIVEQHAHLPDMFTIRFHDPGVELLDGDQFRLADELEISAETAVGDQHVLITGEITALEPDFEPGMTAELTVRGFDKSHRLYRQSKSRAFLNHKDSDVAHTIAQELGLKTDGVAATTTVYDYICQHNQSDLAFLTQRAWRIGYECYVADGTLYFQPPPTKSGNVTLTWGDDLLRFHPSLTMAEQVDEVQVRSWDPANQKPILGRAQLQNGRLYPAAAAAKPDQVAGSNGRFDQSRRIIVDQPVVSQAEADILAAARLDEISGAFLTAAGEALRRPDVRAGHTVTLDSLGERLSGDYLVTAATHIYNQNGLTTHFQVSGSRSGLLADALQQKRPFTPRYGLVTAVVTNTDDPQNWGRVKVKYPWLSDEVESDWARVVGMGAGPDAGLCLTPEVGHEVLVAFEHGDFHRPLVLGGVWNGRHAPPPPVANAAAGERPQIRSWTSLRGHQITMYDNADEKMHLQTAGGHQIDLDDANQKITIRSSGGLTITLDDGSQSVTIDSSKDVTVSAGGNLKLSANGNVDIEATAQVNVKGQMINLN